MYVCVYIFTTLKLVYFPALQMVFADIKPAHREYNYILINYMTCEFKIHLSSQFIVTFGLSLFWIVSHALPGVLAKVLLDEQVGEDLSHWPDSELSTSGHRLVGLEILYTKWFWKHHLSISDHDCYHSWIFSLSTFFIGGS